MHQDMFPMLLMRVKLRDTYERVMKSGISSFILHFDTARTCERIGPYAELVKLTLHLISVRAIVCMVKCFPVLGDNLQSHR